MYTEQVTNYSATCNNLDTLLRDVEVKIRMSEQNAKLRDQYCEQLNRHEGNIKACTAVMERIKPLIADTQKYINDKRVESMLNINNALRLAGDIIPDSASGIHFKIEGDEAWLATSDDLTVQNTEGGGYRQVSSSFVRSVVLSSNPDLIQTLILDEMFACVSVENTAQLSLYLNVLCQDKQVICIEQKPEIASNIDATIYNLKKGTEFVEVEKITSNKFKEVKNEEV